MLGRERKVAAIRPVVPGIGNINGSEATVVGVVVSGEYVATFAQDKEVESR